MGHFRGPKYVILGVRLEVLGIFNVELMGFGVGDMSRWVEEGLEVGSRPPGWSKIRGLRVLFWGVGFGS